MFAVIAHFTYTGSHAPDSLPVLSYTCNVGGRKQPMYVTKPWCCVVVFFISFTIYYHHFHFMQNLTFDNSTVIVLCSHEL